MKKNTGFLMGLGLGLAFAAGGAVAFATIPSAGGVIHGCYANNGNLRVIDADAGQTCKPAETPINWNQTGPAGQPGPAGTALAYAHVNADGTIDHDSGNITVVHIFDGAYCIGVSGGTVHVGVASLDARANVGGNVQVGVYYATDCPPEASDAFVETRPHNQDGGFPGADRAFYLIVN